MHRRAAVERHVEVFAKGRTQRRLETTIDADLFQHGREEIAAGCIQDFCQRARFGLDPRQLGPGILKRWPGSTFRGAGIDDRLFRIRYGSLGFLQQRHGLFDQHALLGRIRQAGDLGEDV
jgi:hypothetical protein